MNQKYDTKLCARYEKIDHFRKTKQKKSKAERLIRETSIILFMSINVTDTLSPSGYNSTIT